MSVKRIKIMFKIYAPYTFFNKSLVLVAVTIWVFGITVAVFAYEQLPYASGVCGKSPSNVILVDTGMLSTQYTQRIFSPNANQIMTFIVEVPTAGVTHSDFVATKTTGSPVTKLVSVSECPGEYGNPLAEDVRVCVKFSTESSRIYLTSNQIAPRSFCVLQPGRKYFINTVSRFSIDSPDASCSDDCSFYVSRNGRQ